MVVDRSTIYSRHRISVIYYSAVTDSDGVAMATTMMQYQANSVGLIVVAVANPRMKQDRIAFRFSTRERGLGASVCLFRFTYASDRIE